jgi:crotonobetainyl-CoA:carnitine CoA-transferase CaiB-like acyl-CoA transferase
MIGWSATVLRYRTIMRTNSFAFINMATLLKKSSRKEGIIPLALNLFYTSILNTPTVRSWEVYSCLREKIMVSAALTGINVLEYATMVSGPYCSKLLADLGADVIKAEPPDGDPARFFGPFPNEKPHPEKSALFLYNNTSKRGITIDIRTSEGKEQFSRLIQWADVFIDNHMPGHLMDTGFGDETIQRLNPSLVYTSITPYGRTGPRAATKGDEITIAHASGFGNLLPFLSVNIERAPVKPGGFQIAYRSAISAAMVTVAALVGRGGKTGKGCLIDISMQEVGIGHLRSHIAYDRYEHTTWSRVPDRPPGVGRMKTHDGYLFISINEAHHFQILREVLGNPEWMAGDQWLDDTYRNFHFMDIAPMMNTLMGKQNTQEISETLANRGVPIGSFNTVKDILKNRQYEFRHFFNEVEHPVAGNYVYPGWPYLMDRSPPRISRPAPLLGQHTEEIVHKELSQIPKRISTTLNSENFREKVPELLLPLRGIRVADFSWVLAGPFTGMLLAMLGAEVIKVEGHRRMDLLRRRVSWPLAEPVPIGLPPNQGMGFNCANLNKKSITIDISKPKGAILARQLAVKCDIVLDNMRPNVMYKLGLGYETLRQLRPDIIVLSSSSKGQDGPERDFPGYATTHSANGGLAYITGYIDDFPSTTFSEIDIMNATNVAFVLLAALYHRLQTGEGQFIDYSQCEGVTSLLGEMVLGYQMTGRIPERMGNAHPYYAPHNLYRCWGVDRWLALEIHTDQEFAILTKIIGRHELAQDVRYKTMKARKRNEKSLDKIIEQWTHNRDRDSMVNELCQAGLAAAPSRNWQDLYADPHLCAREAFVKVQHPELGLLELVGVPWRMSGYSPPSNHAPLLGEHNNYVLQQLLGLSEAQIAELRGMDIIC